MHPSPQITVWGSFFVRSGGVMVYYISKSIHSVVKHKASTYYFLMVYTIKIPRTIHPNSTYNSILFSALSSFIMHKLKEQCQSKIHYKNMLPLCTFYTSLVHLDIQVSCRCFLLPCFYIFFYIKLSYAIFYQKITLNVQK